jgi:flagellar assembly factor FliW
MINLPGTRFGNIEIEEGSDIHFAQGLFGFPDAHRYALLYPGGNGRVAWLQSLDVPALAFPIVEGSALGPNYPEPSPAKLAQDAGLDSAEPTILVIIAAQKGGGLIANMLAPLVIDMANRKGAQIVLDPKVYSADTPLRPVPQQQPVPTTTTATTAAAAPAR